MSYVHSHADPAARAKAVILVGSIHALLGVGLVIGLTFTGVITVPTHIDVINVDRKEDPEIPPPPPDETVVDDSFVKPVAPIPPLDLGNRPPVETDVFDSADPLEPTGLVAGPTPLPTFAAPLPTPSASPSFAAIGARPRNSQSGWITNDDYPRAGITRQLEGTARYRLIVGSNGRVDACEITASTGHQVLDAATCRLIERNARFDAAKDETGRTVVGTFTGQVTWQIPD